MFLKAIHVYKFIAILVVIAVYNCSVPGRARDDIHRFRVSDDVS